MSDHPASFRLESVAAGESDQGVTEHIGSCASCGAFVTKLRDGQREFEETSGRDADAFARKIRAIADRERSSTRPGESPAWAKVLRIGGPLLAAAAAVFFLVRPSDRLDPRGLGASATGRDPEVVASAGEPVRFKGGIQVAVIRDRAGQQDRIVSTVGIRPGDRLRAEVSVDAPRPIVVGVLDTDGSWTVLLAPAELGPGTHFTEQAARFDDHPTDGWLVAGEPSAVLRARASRVFDDVIAVKLKVEGRP